MIPHSYQLSMPFADRRAAHLAHAREGRGGCVNSRDSAREHTWGSSKWASIMSFSSIHM